MKKASAELEAFINDMNKRASKKGYHPTVFMGMRRDYGTIPAISELVRSGELQSGFTQLRKIEMLDWTIEAAVEKFPKEFDADDRECAAFRLNFARSKEALDCLIAASGTQREHLSLKCSQHEQSQ